MTWREKCRICQELLVRVCSLLNPLPTKAKYIQQLATFFGFHLFMATWMTSLLMISFVWGLVYMFWVAEWPQTGCIFSSLVGKGLSSINPMDRFLFVCGTSKGGGGGAAGEHVIPPYFRQNWAHGAKAKPPSSLRVWMIGPPLFISFRTSTHWASLSSVGGWTCNLADRHCCIITLMDGHPLTAFDAMPITKNY